MKTTTIPFSYLTEQIWTPVVLVTPHECRKVFIPGRRQMVAYRAYFPFLPAIRLFDLVLPASQLKREIEALRPELRPDPTQPISLEVFKQGYSLRIRNMRNLTSQE